MQVTIKFKFEGKRYLIDMEELAGIANAMLLEFGPDKLRQLVRKHGSFLALPELHRVEIHSPKELIGIIDVIDGQDPLDVWSKHEKLALDGHSLKTIGWTSTFVPT